MKNKILIAIGILLVITLGVSFAYFVSGIAIGGSGSNASGTTAELIKVSYDAGSSTLSATGLYPGKNASKTFKVTVTPGTNTNEATYAIKLNITNNSFVKCDDTNYDSFSNACTLGAEELIYTLKDASGNVIKTGDLTGKTGEITIARETKTVSSTTDYNYTLEITFKETNADQNHNANKTITGNVIVEFSELGITAQSIIASSTISSRTSFNTVFTTSTSKTLYTAEDDDGTSYYYAGAATDNYVKFAGFYWRIVRINGDGTIRLIYAGDISTIDIAGKETILANGFNDSTTKYSQIEESLFSIYDGDNAYVGYMYTIGEAHGLGTSSIIKGVLESWYNNNLSNYVDYISSDTGFCGDRSINSGSGTGIGSEDTWYAAFDRVWSTYSPTLKCTNTSDYYTPTNSTKGNKALTYPIGLITIDEAIYAGGKGGVSNKKYYLYNGNYHWTITPYSLEGELAAVFTITDTGEINIGMFGTEETYGVRPVINLRADTEFAAGGAGTSTNPYIVA